MSGSPPGPGTLCLDVKHSGLLGRARLRYRSWGRRGGRAFSSTFLAVSLAPRAGTDPRGLQTPTSERQIKKALSVNKTRPSFPRAGEGRRSPPGERRGKSTACPRRREEREEGSCSIQSCSRAIMAVVEKFQHVLQSGGKGPKGRTPAFPKHHRVLPQGPGLCTDRSLLWPLHQPLTAAPARPAALVALLTKLLRAASGPSW